MCLDHVGQLTRSKPRRTKRGGEHHIATDHGPMVRRKLLTTHPGSVNGGGNLPEVDPPSGRVPGRGLLVLPIFEARRRRNRGKIAKKGSVPEGFTSRGIYRRRGAARGGPWAPGAPLARPRGWPGRVAS